MAATKRVRWQCPNGCPAVLGSTRPPADSMTRFCVTCSVEKGRLVRRSVPALEKKREQSRERSQAKAQAKGKRTRAQERAKTHIVLTDAAGRRVEINPEKTARAMWIQAGYRVNPDLTWNRSRWGSSGHGSSYKVHLSIGVHDSLETFVMLVLHEGAHAQAGGGAGHGPRWLEAYASGVKKTLNGVIWLGGVKHRYDDIDPHVIEYARDASLKSRRPILGREIKAKEQTNA